MPHSLLDFFALPYGQEISALAIGTVLPFPNEERRRVPDRSDQKTEQSLFIPAPLGSRVLPETLGTNTGGATEDTVKSLGTSKASSYGYAM